MKRTAYRRATRSTWRGRIGRLAAAVAILAAWAGPAAAQSTATYAWQFQGGGSEVTLEDSDTAVIVVYLVIDSELAGWNYDLDVTHDPSYSTGLAVIDVQVMEEAVPYYEGGVADIGQYTSFADIDDQDPPNNEYYLPDGAYVIEELTIQGDGTSGTDIISFAPEQGTGYNVTDVVDGVLTFYDNVVVPEPLTVHRVGEEPVEEGGDDSADGSDGGGAEGGGENGDNADGNDDDGTDTDIGDDGGDDANDDADGATNGSDDGDGADGNDDDSGDGGDGDGTDGDQTADGGGDGNGDDGDGDGNGDGNDGDPSGQGPTLTNEQLGQLLCGAGAVFYLLLSTVGVMYLRFAGWKRKPPMPR